MGLLWSSQLVLYKRFLPCQWWCATGTCHPGQNKTMLLAARHLIQLTECCSVQLDLQPVSTHQMVTHR